MADGLNRVELIGNLGDAASLRFTANGRPVANLRICTTETYYVGEGDSREKKENKQWHSATLWGPRAEALATLLTKGTRVFVEGRLEYRSYEDKDGIKRTTAEVNVSNIILLGAPQGSRDNADKPEVDSRSTSAGRPAANGDARPSSSARSSAASGSKGKGQASKEKAPPPPVDDDGGDDRGSDDDMPF